MNGLSPWFWRYGTRQPQAPPVVPTQAPALEGKYGDIHFRREDIDNDVATVFGIEVFRVRRQGETYLVRFVDATIHDWQDLQEADHAHARRLAIITWKASGRGRGVKW